MEVSLSAYLRLISKLNCTKTVANNTSFWTAIATHIDLFVLYAVCLSLKGQCMYCTITERKKSVLTYFLNHFQAELVPVAFVWGPVISSFTWIFIKVGDKSVGVEGEFSRSHSKFWSRSRDKPRIDLSGRSGWVLSARIGSMGFLWSSWESKDMPWKNLWLWKCSRQRRRRVGILHRSYIQTRSESFQKSDLNICVNDSC